MRRQRGLSLLELVIVVTLIAVAAGLAAATLGGGLAGQQLRGAAREVAAELRFTRAQAIATGQDQVFSLDANSRRWQAAGKHEGELPAALEVIATTARNERPRDGIAAIRFFPDGSATGGRIALAHGEAGWRVDVAWLTGEVTLSRGTGEP